MSRPRENPGTTISALTRFSWEPGDKHHTAGLRAHRDGTRQKQDNKMQGTPSQDNSTTGFMCITNYRTMEGCNINLNHAAEKMQQASATGKTEEPEATRTITLLVTCSQDSSIIGEMGRRKKSIQEVTNTWVCICGTDDCIVLTLRVLAFTSAGICKCLY